MCLRFLAIGFVLVLNGYSVARAQSNNMKTHIYKQVGALDIKADIYSLSGDAVSPAVIWIHGGALINGNREGVIESFRDQLIARGCTFVSIDYRLAPETKLPQIHEDVVDAVRWVREVGPTKFGIDASRVAVAGGSAGGYLTLVCGYRVQPPPQALVSVSGYGDLIGSWYSQPSKHVRHNSMKATPEKAIAQVTGNPIADSRDRKGDGRLFYQYCRQTGLWPKLVTGWDPTTESEKFFPYMPLRNVSPKYPPTLLIHGDADTDVPFEQSTLMQQVLVQSGVENQLIRLAGGEHGLAANTAEKVSQTIDSAVGFILSKLKTRD